MRGFCCEFPLGGNGRDREDWHIGRGTVYSLTPAQRAVNKGNYLCHKHLIEVNNLAELQNADMH